LSLADIEEATRIRRGFLEALEEERFADLPAPIYARGFIRTYSSFLGLDPQPLLQRYTAQVGTESTPEPLMLDEPLMRRAGPGLGATLFLAVMVLLVFAGLGWYGYNRFYLGVDPFASLGQTPASPGPATTAAGTAAQPAAERTRPAGATLPAPTSLYTPTATPVTPTPTRAATVAATATPIRGILVVAEVIAPTYIEVTVDGEELFVGTLQMGETPTWQGDERVNLRVGNAGGISLTVNGVEVGALGAPGEVLTVEYGLDNLPQPQ
jgi:cytoskeletal protein RodZ